MNIKLSQKQIGKRITELRKMKGLSQEVLAKSVKISRPSFAQIELGNRSVDILELQQLSLILEFSLDDFMSKDFSASQEFEDKEEIMTKKQEERISVPTLQIGKLNFHYILPVTIFQIKFSQSFLKFLRLFFLH